MRAAGFEYDSTFGFPDRNGFRLGVADVLPLWNSASQQVNELEEVPFAWMDRALSKYQGVEQPEAWVDEAIALTSACQDVEGLWVGIWHPNLTSPLGYPRAPAAFARLARKVSQAGAYVATLDEIVEWRRSRRGVRVPHLGSDGQVELAGGGADRVRIDTPT